MGIRAGFAEPCPLPIVYARPLDDEADLAMRPKRFEVENYPTFENLECSVSRKQLVLVLADVWIDVLKAHAIDDEIGLDEQCIAFRADNTDIADHVVRA